MRVMIAALKNSIMGNGNFTGDRMLMSTVTLPVMKIRYVYLSLMYTCCSHDTSWLLCGLWPALKF